MWFFLPLATLDPEVQIFNLTHSWVHTFENLDPNYVFITKKANTAHIELFTGTLLEGEQKFLFIV